MVRFIVPILLYTVVTETKEVTIMKTVHQKKKNLCIYRHYRRPYPNAVDPAYFTDKLIDGILSIVASMGTVTFFFFLLTM